MIREAVEAEHLWTFNDLETAIKRENVKGSRLDWPPDRLCGQKPYLESAVRLCKSSIEDWGAQTDDTVEGGSNGLTSPLIRSCEEHCYGKSYERMHNRSYYINTQKLRPMNRLAPEHKKNLISEITNQVFTLKCVVEITADSSCR